MINKIANFFLVSFLLLAVTLTTQAQTTADTLQTMIIDFWPDYDQSNVLVLLTGTLPANTSLPAQVTIPLPEDAVVHAVARITNDGSMIDDVTYSTEGSQLQMTVPESRFRVEYYVPYTVEGDTHSFTFNWLSSTTVNEMLAAVQEPVAATNLVTQPTAVDVTESSSDGFTYHAYPDQAVPGGQPYTLSFSYTMENQQLSSQSLPAPISSGVSETAVVNPPISAPESSGPTINWILLLSVAAIVVAAVALTWVIATQRTGEARKPQPVRSKTSKTRPAASTSPKKKSAVGFCHECGAPLRAGDQFCRNCGTAVKHNK